MSSSSHSKIDVARITDASDIPLAYSVVYACFNDQVPDAILQAFNPNWTTPEGYGRAVQRTTESFNNSTTKLDQNGNPTQLFLKATTTDTTGKPRIVGYAIWIQLSTVEGQGEPPILNGHDALDLEDLYPNDESEQKYCGKLFETLHQNRHELIHQQSSASPPAIMALDLCVVHPDFQRRGIASKLVQYGLDEAQRRGGLVCCTEASPMGRTVYAKLGFRQQGPEIEYGVDGAKFARGGMPSNVFMRTQAGNG